MYPKKNLYHLYKSTLEEKDFSSDIPDITKKRTLDLMNIAVHCAEQWNYAIDIGGGNGHYGLPLTQKFKQVSLVEPDIHPEQQKLAQKYSNFSVINKMIEDADLPQKADFVLLADVFEHIADIRKFVQQVSHVQEHGGVVYIMTPNPIFCGPAVESVLHHSKIGIHGHIRHYFKSEVIELMKEGGYDLVHFSYEESRLRAPIRIIVRGLSRRDKKYSRHGIYRSIIGPLCRLVLLPILWLLEQMVYYSEIAHRDDAESCMSAVYIFKK